MTTRPLLYHEWRRQNKNGNRNGYQAYLNEMGWGNGDPLVAGIVDKLYGDDDDPVAAEVAREQANLTLYGTNRPERRFTRDEVTTALGKAANLMQDIHDSYEDGDTLAADATVDLALNAAGYLLEHPGATLDEAIISSYGDVVELDGADFRDSELVLDSQFHEDLVPPEKGSDAWEAALVRKVLGWLA